MGNKMINNNFFGKIDGKTIYDFSSRLDYRLDLDDRVELVKQLFIDDETGELEKYFTNLFTQKYDLKSDNYCEENVEEEVDMDNLSYTGANTSAVKLILSKNDSLYSESNICEQISKIADYLIFAMPKDERIEYKVYTDKDLFKKEMREDKIEHITGGEKLDEVIHILLEKNKNFKLVKKEEITEEDILKYSELKDYNDMLKNVTKRLKRVSLLEKLFNKTKWFKFMDNLTTEDKELMKALDITYDHLNREYYKEMQKQKGQLMKQSALLKQDMLDIKQSKLGTIHFKEPLADSCGTDYDMLDLFQEDQVTALLKVKSNKHDLQRDLGCIISDLDKLIEDTELNDTDMEILKLYRSDIPLEKIGERFGIAKNTAHARVKRIVKDICLTYEKQYEDSYYLNIVKGKYKTCSKCGKSKIANTNNYAQDKSKKDGFKTQCKECISKK